MKVVKFKLSELTKAEKNVRMHPEAQIKEYKRSLEKFGQTKPLTIDENNVILIGNGAFIAMLELGWTEAYCIKRTDLSNNDKKKLMMADNRIFNLGTDDIGAIEDIIRELGEDLDVPGYTDELLESLCMDFEEVSDTLAEYGKLDDEEVEYIKTSEVKTQNIIPQQTSAPGTGNVPDINVGHKHAEETEVSQTFVMCPTCGEKIWL